MKIRYLLAITGVAFVALASELQAQLHFEVAPFAGGTVFLADPPSSFHLHRQGGEPITVVDGSFDNALTLGVNAGFRVNDRWAIEALFSWIPTKLVSPTRTEDVDAYMYGITGLFYIPVSGRFHPFVGAGIGAETMNYAASRVETHTELMGNVVGGLYVAVTEMTGLRFEARDCFARFDSGMPSVDDAWENDLMLTLGLSFRTPIG